MADTISQQYRQLAEGCRKSAQTFSDPNARARMLGIAAEYERKGIEAETRIGAREAEKTTSSTPVIADWSSKDFG
jgi:hypothetical protein